MPFEDNPSANSRRNRADQVAILPDKLTEAGEKLKKYLLSTGPWQALGWDKTLRLPLGDRWQVADMYKAGWGLAEGRMRKFNLLWTSHDAPPEDELVARCSTCHGRIVHTVCTQMRVWRMDEKTILTSDEYSASVAKEEGYVEVSVEMFVRQAPAGEGAAAAAQQPRGNGGIRVAPRFPPFEDGEDGNGAVISKSQVVIDAVERGFFLDGDDAAYDAMYRWGQGARNAAWADDSINTKTHGTKFSGFMAVYWALTHDHEPKSTWQDLEKAGGRMLAKLCAEAKKCGKNGVTRYTCVRDEVTKKLASS